jgi:hypothetical protein
MLNPVFLKVHQILSHGICSPLIPIGSLIDCLLGSEEFNKATIEVVEGVGLPQMAMQTFRQKLSQNVGPIQSAIDTVADGNVDQSVFRRKWNGRLGSNFRERKKTRSTATAENQSDGFGEIHRETQVGIVTAFILPTGCNPQSED